MHISKWIVLHAVLLVLVGLLFLLYSPLVIAWLGLGQVVQDSEGYWAMVSFARLFGMALIAWGATLVVASQLDHQADLPAQIQRKLLWVLIGGDFLGAFSAAVQSASVWGVPASWFISLGFAVLGIISLGLLVFTKRDVG